ncbi:MAG TPA: cupin domain-containing protein [Candidatus Binataceae bacterium]|nr:cupin domain-containing protein [Candidatus Binataceae bacterium]
MARCRIFSIDENLLPVVEGGLYTKSFSTARISVSVVKFVSPGGAALKGRPHSHGEEASFQIEGGCSVFQPDDAPGAEYRMEAGEALLIPADSAHYGTNRFGAAGISMRLNVVSPPRAEFIAKDAQPFYPLAEPSPKRD